MIESSTTIILGAGASFSYGLPLGSGLLDIVVNELIYKKPQRRKENPLGDRESSKFGGLSLVGLSGFEDMYEEYEDDTKSNNRLFQMIMDNGHSKKEIEDFCFALKESKLGSIDYFLEFRQEFIPIGKMAIVYCLLKYENEDDLFSSNSDWYRILWNSLVSKPENFYKNNLNIITFNYDRSLELYLSRCISNTFGLDLNESYDLLVKSINIIHLHGKLGNLNTNEYTTKGESLNFYGEQINDSKQLKEFSESIKIILDDVSDSQFNQATLEIAKSEKVIFMGFGYNQTTLDRLNFESYYYSSQLIIGTGLGLSNVQIEKIKADNPFFSDIANYSSDCAEFLKEWVIL